jgi:hypothetical protein
MTKLAIGPRRSFPSWAWVGQDTANELAKDHDVSLFDDFDTVPSADIVFVVKQRPPVAFVTTARQQGARVVYAPIDIYDQESEIYADADMLQRCDLVFLHGEDLLPHISCHTSRIELVEHHLRYALQPMATRKQEGFVLWIGATLNLPHVVRWLEENPLPYEVRLLTSLGREQRVLAHLTAYKQGLRLRFEEGRINGFAAAEWSEARQEQWMRACRAAIDVKGATFSQSTKPPTKAQQFIASGIPFACNADSPVARYFARRGFDVARPQDTTRLFSESYWIETRQLARKLRVELSLPTVAETYRRALANLMAAGPPIA